jgi:hypothetical protein
MRLVVAFLVLLGCASAQARTIACKSNPKVVESCYEVRGVLFYANGGPSTRIRIAGTKRILGVLDEEDGMPEYISNLIQTLMTKFMSLSWYAHMQRRNRVICDLCALNLARI